MDIYKKMPYRVVEALTKFHGAEFLADELTQSSNHIISKRVFDYLTGLNVIHTLLEQEERVKFYVFNIRGVECYLFHHGRINIHSNSVFIIIEEENFKESFFVQEIKKWCSENGFKIKEISESSIMFVFDKNEETIISKIDSVFDLFGYIKRESETEAC